MQLNFRRIGAVFVGATVFAAVHALICVVIEEYLEEQVRWVANGILEWRFAGFGSFGRNLRLLLCCLMYTAPSLLAALPAYFAFERISAPLPLRSVNRSQKMLLSCVAFCWISTAAVMMMLTTPTGSGILENIAKFIEALIPMVPRKWVDLIEFVLIATALFTFWLTVFALWTARPGADAEPRCRKCGYILRGLVDNRCPECFTPFEPVSSGEGSQEACA